MKLFKIFSAVFWVALAAGSVTIHAQDKPLMSAASVTTENMADGEIKKIDRENKKITIKHGELKNLDMLGMTMVFQIRDATILETFKAGDKVKFLADKLDGAFVVTDMQLAK